MKTPMLGLRTVIYKVADIEAGKDWYNQAFGTTPYFDQPFYVGYNIGGYELGLQPEVVPAERKGESVTTYWGVNDVQAEYERLLELGATSFEVPENVGGPIVVAAVKDPWENPIGLIYNPEFKAL